MTTDVFMTTDEVAAYLRLAPKTLRNWRHVGGGPVATMIGANVRYRRSDVDRWVNSRRESRTRERAS